LLPDISSLGLGSAEDDNKGDISIDLPQYKLSSARVQAHSRLVSGDRRGERGGEHKPLTLAKKDTQTMATPSRVSPQILSSSVTLEELNLVPSSDSVPAVEKESAVAPPLTMNSLMETGNVKV
jgi:hypothetical protein